MTNSSNCKRNALKRASKALSDAIVCKNNPNIEQVVEQPLNPNVTRHRKKRHGSRSHTQRHVKKNRNRQMRENEERRMRENEERRMRKKEEQRAEINNRLKNKRKPTRKSFFQEPQLVGGKRRKSLFKKKRTKKKRGYGGKFPKRTKKKSMGKSPKRRRKKKLI